MRYLLILLSSLLISCSDETICDWYTDNGICINNNGYDIDEEKINWIVNVTAEEMVEHYGITLDDLYAKASRIRMFIRFVKLGDTELKKYKANGLCYAHTDFTRTKITDLFLLIGLKENYCLAYTPLYHELIHAFYWTINPYEIGGDPHPEDLFKSSWSVEFQIMNRLWTDNFGRCGERVLP